MHSSYGFQQTLTMYRLGNVVTTKLATMEILPTPLLTSNLLRLAHVLHSNRLVLLLLLL